MSQQAWALTVTFVFLEANPSPLPLSKAVPTSALACLQVTSSPHGLLEVPQKTLSALQGSGNAPSPGAPYGGKSAYRSSCPLS